MRLLHLCTEFNLRNKWDIQDNKLNKAYESKALVCYNMLYYSITRVYHEITTKSFTRPTVTILCRL